MNDLKFAIRQLLKNPGFTAVAVLTLALGIGANTAVFSVVKAVLLRPPPYKEPERLVWLFESKPREGYHRLNPHWANETFAAMLEQSRSIEQSARIRTKQFLLQFGDRVEPVRGMRVSANLFDLLGVRPALGRTFLAEENEWGRHRVVILSHGCWQRKFGGDSAIVNQTIDLVDTELSDRDGAPHDTTEVQRHTVIGILPPGWRFPTGASPGGNVGGFEGDGEIWQPESLTPSEKQRRSVLDNIVARLKPDVTLPQAQAEIQTLFGRLREQVEARESVGSIEVMPLTRQVIGNTRPALLLLSGATCCVLLIACVNVANLLLARASGRHKEFAIRAALGAGRARVLRQLLTESVVLSLAGGVCGLLLALWGTTALAALSPANLPRVDEVKLDAGVFAFTFGLSLLTGLAFGLAPALRASKADVNEALKEGGRGLTTGFSSQGLRQSLVVSEVAVSFVLLVGAGLLIRSFVKLVNIDPGFGPGHVLTRPLSFRHPQHASDDVAVRLDELLERLRAMPGVSSAAVASWLPIAGGSNRFAMGFGIEGRSAPEPGAPGSLRVCNMSMVTPDYFRTMGIPLLKGRDFQPADLVPGAAAVKIISESFARRFLPGEEPLGIRVSGGEIVGVVKDTRDSGLDTLGAAHLYHPGIHTGPLGLREAALAIRTAKRSAELSSAVEAAVLAWDNNQPALGVTSVKQILSESVASRRFQMFLLGLFAALALLLAAVGIYGVMAYMVTQRTHEIGIRMALGARHPDVLWLVVRHGLRLVAGGVVIGLAAALASTRAISSLLFSVSATDPATYAVVALVLIAVALLACALPARRAARVQPMEALRYE